MSGAALAEDTALGSLALRNEPVQARSTARLAGLIDAAAAVIDEVGYERLTTAMVAERAGASIGTVYRYFPDRIAVLQALGARNLDRVLSRVSAAVADQKYTDWASALTAAFDVLVAAFRDEPGFRSLRVGDVIDLRPAPVERTYNSVVAETILDGLATRFDLTVDDDTRFAFEAAIEISDALAARAFARDTEDAHFLQAAKDAVYALLAPRFGAPAR
ncbi:TetR/AcrR family transcriptional regulator [Galbitalea sp. SE-J8]|uniref:TetR/AcrR family transcriptional regulator n=1 Tax=Galbitalea sp. SE-J8 TaxID=3054952 RepID=UPI00259C72BE|nr:TetR/AcrR family transcriptional regulator [Galbitalea sp. SE-J8]MDM4761789.1 TetR/AcrR family transcriptional regulator [Galbitalea sp. SE-J8]